MKDTPTEELARDNARLRGDLLTIGSRISHDLRTPLGNVLNSAELLREVLVENHLPTGQLDSVFSSVDEMMRLIRSVSLLTRASARPTTLKRTNMSIAAYTAWQHLERQIARSSARVDVPDPWPDVDGVTDWLEFIWWNLLSNALRHGGKQIAMGWQKQGGGHKFFVRDNGRGVPPERRKKLFQPFQELHQPDGANGLGLAMTRRLVELQNGTCGYETDNGTCFYFVLPAATSPASEPAPRRNQNVVMNYEEAT